MSDTGTWVHVARPERRGPPVGAITRRGTRLRARRRHLARPPRRRTGDGLYALAIFVTPRVPTGEVLTHATAIRLVTYSCCGLLVGWFANQHRRHLRELRELAERDFLTGILNTRVFDEALARRCTSGRPFLLLLADMDDLKLVNARNHRVVEQLAAARH